MRSIKKVDITIEVKNNYGNLMYYPVCEKADLFARISGKKTLTEQCIKDIKSLGYTIKVKQQELSV